MNAKSIGSRVLDPINISEHTAGRPMLSALVVGKTRGTPGHGFFILAKHLGLFDGRDRKKFWQEERDRVYEHWTER